MLITCAYILINILLFIHTFIQPMNKAYIQLIHAYIHTYIHRVYCKVF